MRGPRRTVRPYGAGVGARAVAPAGARAGRAGRRPRVENSSQLVRARTTKRRRRPPSCTGEAGLGMIGSALVVAVFHCTAAQAPTHAPSARRHDMGFVGVYHSATGTVHDGHDTPAQAVGNWGIVALANHGFDGSQSFAQNIEQNCRQADVNILMGMVIAHSEGGTFNNTNDTELLRPHNTTQRGAPSPPGGPAGMLQAAARWSTLSRTLCPQIQGIVIDDFFVNYKACTKSPVPPTPAPAPPGKCAACPETHPSQYGSISAGEYCCSGSVSCGHCHGSICCMWPGVQEGCQAAGRCGSNPGNYTPCKLTPPSPPDPSCEEGAQVLNLAHMRDLKAALHGKRLLANGHIDHNSPAVTPHLKLFVVTYTHDVENSLSNCSLFREGIVDGLSLWVGGNVAESVSRARTTIGWRIPVLTGAYIYNSVEHWHIQPQSFYALMNQSIELYDRGDVEGFFSEWSTALIACTHAHSVACAC